MDFISNILNLFDQSTTVFYGLQQFVFLVFGVLCCGVIFKIFSCILKGRY